MQKICTLTLWLRHTQECFVAISLCQTGAEQIPFLKQTDQTWRVTSHNIPVLYPRTCFMPFTVLLGPQLRKLQVRSSLTTHSWSESPVCAPTHRAAADILAGPVQASAVSLDRSPSGQQWPPGPGQGNPSACAPAPAAIAPEGLLSESFLGEKR